VSPRFDVQGQGRGSRRPPDFDGTLIAALAGYSHAVERRWPIPTARSAWTIGGIWLSSTVVFEFVFGHYVAGESWTSLLRNYDARKGRIWGLVPISMAILPVTVRALHAKR
jgi:hypothetical protein